MGKLATFILLMGGITILFYYGGLLTELEGEMCKPITPNALLISYLIEPECATQSTTWTKIILALSGVGAALVLGAGLFINNVELTVMGPVAIFIFNLLWDFISVFNRVRTNHPVFAVILFGPLMLLFIITILDWWRGRD